MNAQADETAAPSWGQGTSKGARKRREKRRQQAAAAARELRKAQKRRPEAPPVCPYCDRPSAFLASSSSLYSNGRDYGPVWACLPCRAWVGCHDGTELPLGRLADRTLRQLKSDTHAVFDPIWAEKHRREGGKKSAARGAGYKWLARQLGIRYEDCHIGMFDPQTCRRAIEICRPHFVRIARRATRTVEGSDDARADAEAMRSPPQ